MNTILNLGIFGILVTCVYQDFKFRAISWIVFPLLLCLSFFLAFDYFGINQTVENSLINSCFILLQYSIVAVYYSVKNKELIIMIDRYIGMGDVLFLLAVTPLFSIAAFIVYILITLITVLFVYGIKVVVTKNTNSLIPLAGVLAIALLVYFILNYLHLILLLKNSYGITYYDRIIGDLLKLLSF
jgi:hypothetical protein